MLNLPDLRDECDGNIIWVSRSESSVHIPGPGPFEFTLIMSTIMISSLTRRGDWPQELILIGTAQTIMRVPSVQEFQDLVKELPTLFNEVLLHLKVKDTC